MNTARKTSVSMAISIAPLRTTMPVACGPAMPAITIVR